MAILSNNKLVEMVYYLTLSRRFEEICIGLFQQGIGSAHFYQYSCQEATNVGAILAMAPGDQVFAHHHDFGIALARGVSPKACLSRLFDEEISEAETHPRAARESEVDCGYPDPYQVDFSYLLLATGAALKMQYNSDYTTVLVVADAEATGIGYFQEALSISNTWKLPIIWLIKNVQVKGPSSAGQASKARSKLNDIDAGDIEYWEQIKGMDILQIHAEVSKAADYVRCYGPALIEVLVPGHVRRPQISPGNDQSDANNSILSSYNYLISECNISGDELKGIEQQVQDQLTPIAYGRMNMC